jgi:hypothetical protein
MMIGKTLLAHDCRTIPTFGARISQTVRDACVTFLLNDGTGSVFNAFLFPHRGVTHYHGGNVLWVCCC